MERNGQTSIRYSQLLHIWFTPDVSGRYCPDIIRRPGRYITISASGANRSSASLVKADKVYLRLGHSLALFLISFGHDGAPSLPQELKKITQQLTALPLIFNVEPALNWPAGYEIVKKG